MDEQDVNYSNHVPRITFHASRFTHHVSRITFHASRFTHHVSRITFHASRPSVLLWMQNYRKIRHPRSNHISLDPDGATLLQPEQSFHKCWHSLAGIVFWSSMYENA